MLLFLLLYITNIQVSSSFLDPDTCMIRDYPPNRSARNVEIELCMYSNPIVPKKRNYKKY